MALIDFTVTHRFAASSRAVWDEMIDWPSHANWIPATRMEVDSDDFQVEGATFTGYTGFWKLALVAVALQGFFGFLGSGKVLLRQEFTFSPQMTEDSVVTSEFEVRDRPRKLSVRNSTSLDNNWIGLDLMLVNKARTYPNSSHRSSAS